MVRATRAERAARADADTARQVSDFLVELFEVSDPGVAKGETVTARELLDRGTARITTELAEEPLVRARVESVVGDIYRKLGLYDPAQPLLEDALPHARPPARGLATPRRTASLHALARLHADRKDSGTGGEPVQARRWGDSQAAPDPLLEARVRGRPGRRPARGWLAFPRP